MRLPRFVSRNFKMAMTMHGKSSALNGLGIDSDIYPDWYDAEHKTGVSIGLTFH